MTRPSLPRAGDPAGAPATPVHGVAPDLVAALFAVDPAGLGGVVLRSPAGAARDGWLARLGALLPEATPWRRVPLHVDDDRLLGGLDLTATLQAGRPVAQRGLLADADGGVVLLAMAERLGTGTAASVATVLDTGELVAERHGLGTRRACRIGVVALDEGIAEDEQAPARLRERLAFHLVLPAAPEDVLPLDRTDVLAARARLGGVRLGDPWIEALCGTALALGVDSARAAVLAGRAARAAAALDGRDAVGADDAALAAALVLAPRATRLPATAPAPDAGPEDEPETAGPPPDEPAASAPPPDHPPASPSGDAAPPPPAQPDAPDAEADAAPTAAGPVDDVVLEAALAAMPPHLLTLLALGRAESRRPPQGGGAGALRAGLQRGRPVGVRRAAPQGGARLNLLATLRAAAPWQAVRRREAAAAGRSAPGRLQVRREDFHVWRFQQRNETTTVFVVDASGSSALHRLAEAKGAVELMLAECYVRRDSVAVIAFRGAGAEVLLPPTRSLARAKRSLAGLPGGGGTPLASGIAAARALADTVRRRGATPVVVLLTDGRANIARDGTPGRARAGDDALAAARGLRADGFAVLLLDTSPQPQQGARDLAAALGARYLPLPHAGAGALSQAVKAATPAPAAAR